MRVQNNVNFSNTENQIKKKETQITYTCVSLEILKAELDF